MAPNSSTKSTSSTTTSVMPGSDVMSPDDGPSSSTNGLSSRKRTNTDENQANNSGLMNVAEKLPRISDPLPEWSDSEETVVLTPSMPGCASSILNDNNNREVIVVQDQVLGSTDDELRKCQEKIAQLQRENAEIKADRDSLLRDITFGRSENVLAREQLQNELLEVLEAELGCVICNDVYMEPSVIECGHIFCFHCISNWLSQPNGRNCPTCRITVTKPLKILGLGGYIHRLYSMFTPEVQQDRNQVLVERRVENESREEHRLRRAAELRAQAERELERMIQAVQRLERDTSGSSSRDGHDRVIIPPRGLGPGTISLAEALARSRRRIALQQLPQQQAGSSSQQQQPPQPQSGSSTNPTPTVSSNVPVIQAHPASAMSRAARGGINFSVSLERPGPSSSSIAGPSSSSSSGSTPQGGIISSMANSAPRLLHHSVGSTHNLLLQPSPDGRTYPVFRIGQYNSVRAHPSSSSSAQVHVTNSVRMQDCHCGRNSDGNPTSNPSPYHRCHHHQHQDTQQNSSGNPAAGLNHPCRVQLISGGRIQPITGPLSNSRSIVVGPQPQMGASVQHQPSSNDRNPAGGAILHHLHQRHVQQQQQQQMWNNPNIGIGAGGTSNNNSNDNNNPLNLATEGMNNNFGNNDGRNTAAGNNLRANDDHDYWHGFHF